MTPSSSDSVTIRRTLNASQAQVFAAWTQPEHLSKWWRAHPSFTSPVVEIDLRVGGRYRLGMQEPGKDAPYVCHGEFKVVDPPRKLVYTWSWEQGMDVRETLVTVEFLKSGEQTELVITHSGFTSTELAAQHDQGWNGCLDVLVDLLEQ